MIFLLKLSQSKNLYLHSPKQKEPVTQSNKLQLPPRKGQHMRDTLYATELARATYYDARIERLHVKETGDEQIRFSWWPNDKMAQRPLDLTEEDLLKLFAEAIKEDVFTDSFKNELSKLLT